VDHADSGLEGGADSLYHSVRGTHSTGVTQTPFTQKFGQARITPHTPEQNGMVERVIRALKE
ncbi:hypothetical protein PQU95_08165, partial [Vogesella sp. DC21W]